MFLTCKHVKATTRVLFITKAGHKAGRSRSLVVLAMGSWVLRGAPFLALSILLKVRDRDSSRVFWLVKCSDRSLVSLVHGGLLFLTAIAKGH